MQIVVPLALGALAVGVVGMAFLVVALIRHVDDLDRRVAQLGMAMPGNVGRLGLKVGTPAPRIEGPTLSGGRFLPTVWSNRERLVLFAHPGCAPCEELMPDLVASVDHADLPPTIVISDGPPDDHPALWRDASHSDRLAVVLQERSALARRFETFVTPHLFVIDARGLVVEQGIASSLDEVKALYRRARKRGGRAEPAPIALGKR